MIYYTYLQTYTDVSQRKHANGWGCTDENYMEHHYMYFHVIISDIQYVYSVLDTQFIE